MKWTKRLRERRRAARPRERVDWPWLVFLLLLLAGFAFLYAYPRLKAGPRPDFDGRVVEKYVALGESYIGSRTQPRLVVETPDGRRLNVAVSDEQYERARVGMLLSRHGGELKLSQDEPRVGAPRGEGTRVEAR